MDDMEGKSSVWGENAAPFKQVSSSSTLGPPFWIMRLDHPLFDGQGINQSLADDQRALVAGGHAFPGPELRARADPAGKHVGPQTFLQFTGQLARLFLQAANGQRPQIIRGDKTAQAA